MKVLFCNIGYMKNYHGVSESDPIVNGGSYVDEHGRGEEEYNFTSFYGKLYGFVETGHYKFSGKEEKIRRINIGRIDEYAKKSDSVSGVTVFFCATPSVGSRVIVGFYRNATVFRERHYIEINGVKREYNIVADVKDAVLIPDGERYFEVPRGKGAYGRSQLWYADGADKYVDSAIKYAEKIEAEFYAK